MSKFLVLVSASIHSVLLPIIAIPVMTIGSVHKSVAETSVLLDIPVFPSTDDRMSHFIGVKSHSDLESFVFPLELQSNFSIPFDISDVGDPGFVQDFYLIHNFWKYKITVTVVDGLSQAVKTFSDMRNIDRIDEDVHHSPVDLLDGMIHDNKSYIKCPLEHIMITLEEDREPDGLGPLLLGEVRRDRITPSIHFVFADLFGLPMDFIQSPQLCIGSWCDFISGTFL
jgi:hypothetical protein